ncbi:MAG: hypothetical protein KKA12_03995, partial [Alphaproteobacteria bacterium]|nr:hypothetical protein [Alphaproteobacteria bacterium]
GPPRPLLLFPYKTELRGFTVRSELPLSRAELEPVLADAERRIATSPLARGKQPRNLYLTIGTWRWNWVALTQRNNFAVSRFLTDSIIFNRTDVARNIVHSRRQIGSTRALSSDIAHEVAHGMIRHHFGMLTALTAPKWVIEGYCDYVAGESTLSEAEVARLQNANITHGTIDNYHARLRVARELTANGGSVDRLFADAR